MADSPSFGAMDIADFSVGAMLRVGIAVRRILRDAESIEGSANLIVRYLYEHCVDATTGERNCALVRFYKTHRYGNLDRDLKEFADNLLGETPAWPDMRCLVLLGTAGDEPEWNSRQASQSHRAIPLPAASAVRAAPMIAHLIEDLGIDIDSIVSGAMPTRRTSARTYDVFHVERASGSPLIPAQDFVERHRIASVVGFGGLLRSGELYAVILFSRPPVAASSAARFRTIALDIRSSLFMLDESKTWMTT